MGRFLKKNEMPLVPINPSLTFEIWSIDFIGPFPNLGLKTRARYIITTVDYVTKWDEAELVESCIKKVAARFINENIITRFACPLTLISDGGTHLINKTIENLLKEYKIEHHKISSYHPLANGVVESFNKALVRGLTKICNLEKTNWDVKIPSILWVYRITYKISTGQTPFKMVYGQEIIVPFHYKYQAP